MKLFRLSCMIDEKQLANVMWALAGNCANLEVNPIKNAEMTREGVKERDGSRTIKETVWNHIVKHRMTEISSAQITDVLLLNGFNKNSTHGAAINPLIKDGFLKYGVKGSGVYLVNATEGK